MTKYIFVTEGVVSSLGNGIASAFHRVRASGYLLVVSEEVDDGKRPVYDGN